MKKFISTILLVTSFSSFAIDYYNCEVVDEQIPGTGFFTTLYYYPAWGEMNLYGAHYEYDMDGLSQSITKSGDIIVTDDEELIVLIIRQDGTGLVTDYDKVYEIKNCILDDEEE